MKKPNIILLLTTLAMLCAAPLFAQFQWHANMVGPNPSIHCGPDGIRVGFSNNQTCTVLMPSITLQFRATASGTWNSITTMGPTSPGATGGYYDFSMAAAQSGYYRAIVSTASGYTPCSGQTVSSYTSTAVQHIVNPIPLAEYNINGDAATFVQTYVCAPILLNYTGTGTVSQYRYKIEECSPSGVVVAGGYSSNAAYAWVNGTVPATTNLNSGAVATRFADFPGNYLLTLQINNGTCSSVERKVRINVASTAPAATAAFKINTITPPTGCTTPMELFGCPAYAITLSNQSTNAVSYKIDLLSGTSNCGTYSQVYSSGFVSAFPTDLKNLPGANGNWLQTHTGFYKVVLTVQNTCGVASTAQTGYINVAGAPTGGTAAFTTTVIAKKNAAVTINNCPLPTATSSIPFKYDVLPQSCGGASGYRFVMQQSNPDTPNIVGRGSTVFDLSAVSAGTGSSSYTVLVGTEKYESGSWLNLNYLGQPESFPGVVNLSLTSLLLDNDTNFTNAPFGGIYRITITVTNECNSYTRRQIIQLVSNTILLSGKLPELNLANQLNEAVTVYPNPATSDVAFEVTVAQEDRMTIDLYDLKGSRVQQVAKDEPVTEGINVRHADLSQLPAGLYFYKIATSDEVYNGKFIKR